MYRVLSPLGEPTVEKVGVAPRLKDLKGKTICEIANGAQHRGPVAFPIIRELLQRRYPDIKVIPYTEFPVQDIHGSTRQILERVEAAVALAEQKGCDAVITGIGM
ncbi:MAG: hypothetical protein HYX92_20705 [Chloroflexi bacterium]|nr:hypothetical protein [Chloroflexota bacterium]